MTCFDCLHDMGDPAGAAAHIRKSLKDDGTWMIVEPMAGDRLEQNLNPVGRLYYAGIDHDLRANLALAGGRDGLGAQAGEAKLREVILKGGFTQRAPRYRNAIQHDPRGEAIGSFGWRRTLQAASARKLATG